MANLAAYEKVRPIIETGDIIAVEGTGPVSKLIQWRTSDETSHVGTFVKLSDVGEDIVFIFQAHARSGVAMPCASVYLKDFKGKAYLYRVSEEARAKHPDYKKRIYEYLRYSGREYDFAGVANYILPFIKPRETAEYCSELVSMPWIDMGAIKRKSYTPGQIKREWVYDQNKVELVA